MKMFIAVIIGLISAQERTENRPKNHYVIPRIEINDVGLQRALSDYTVEFKDDLQDGVLVLKSDPQNNCFYLSYIMYKHQVMEHPPCYFTIAKSKTVLIYTGFESRLSFHTTSFKQLFKMAEKSFVPPGSMNYDPVIWKIEPKGDSYLKVEVERIPLEY